MIDATAPAIAVSGQPCMARMTPGQHRELAPLVIALRSRLWDTLLQYRPSSVTSKRIVRCLRKVETLRSRLDGEWCDVVPRSEGFVYYGTTPAASDSDLLSLAGEILRRVNGYSPARLIDAAIALERSVYMVTVETPLETHNKLPRRRTAKEITPP